MSLNPPQDVREFIEDRLASDQYSSEEAVLRSALQTLAEKDEVLAALNAAIDQIQAGDPGLPLSEAFDERHRRLDAS
jgi:putative addiction module CopG family antidote